MIRARDLDGTGVSRAWLERFTGDILEKVGRGIYAPRGRTFSPLAIAVARAPGATLCLLSALDFHGLLAAPPPEVWFAIHRNARTPRVEGARFVRSAGRCLVLGVERWRVEGVPLSVTSVAKTIVDCFRFSGQVGERAGPEALEEALRTGACTPREILSLASSCRARHKLAPPLMAAGT
ncbi:MAG: type IV toxin-antitoxin system AbiEi family antitoxin domain-containing protein [Myxococcaceae bacterium]